MLAARERKIDIYHATLSEFSAGKNSVMVTSLALEAARHTRPVAADRSWPWSLSTHWSSRLRWSSMHGDPVQPNRPTAGRTGMIRDEACSCRAGGRAILRRNVQHLQDECLARGGARRVDSVGSPRIYPPGYHNRALQAAHEGCERRGLAREIASAAPAIWPAGARTNQRQQLSVFFRVA